MNKKVLNVIAIAAILMLSLVILTGCGAAAKTIVGDWEYSKGSSFVYHFNEDGTGTYMGTMKLTYTENNGAITITYTDTGSTLQGTWEGDTLNVKDSFGSDTIYKRK